MRLVCFLVLATVGCGGSGSDRSRSDVQVEAIPPRLEDTRIELRPGMEQVPLNALEFQVRLKQPIVVTEHSFHLLDAQGQKVEGAVPEWTWDAAFRVATLRRNQPENSTP